ncbi:MAG: hypothetical protein JST68_01325 [Bacteroidetes bacterium]|nr:hypothetical protein [Bacteroidota bacterium]
MRKHILLFCLFVAFVFSGVAQDTNRAKSLLQTALSYVNRPGENKIDLDSALLLIGQADVLSKGNVPLQARTLIVKAKALREKGYREKGRELTDKALALFKGLPASADAGEAYLERVNYYDGNDAGWTSRKECLQQALAQFRQVGLKERQADVLKDIADYNQLLRNYGEAMVNLREALALYQSVGYKSLHGVYDLLGITSTNLADYPGAVKYGLLAAQTAEAMGDTTLQLCTIYSRLGVAYGNWGKNPEAMVYLKKALAIAMKYHDADYIETVILNICYRVMYDPRWEETLRLFQTAEASIRSKSTEDSLYWSCFYVVPYVAGKQYARAGVYANEIIKQMPLCRQKGIDIHFAIQTLSNYYLATGQYKLADKYTSELIDYAKIYKNKRSVAWAYQLKSRADSGLGDYRAALQHFQLARNMADSMTSVSKNMQFAQMQVIYETEKKQQHIELLTSQNQLQEVSLKKAGITRNIIIVTALVLSALLFTGYQFKKRSNAKLRAHQEEINRQNEQLKELLSAQKKLLEEKEWLVKEIHHRVKNNLQVVISLLNTQSEYLDSPSAIRAIRESRERMQAIAIIHQKLYQADNTTVINMPSYIEEMITFLSTSLTNTWKVRFELDIEEINLDISQAVPLGLMLNEAVTNAIKYAFPGDQVGTLFIQLSKVNGSRISLKIKDNGPGLPADFDPNANNSLGMQLMRLFSDQLEGDLLFSCNPGVQISLVFKQYGEEKKVIATTA